MFKRIFFIVLIISQWSLVRSQTISRQVISNGGGTLSGGGNQITFNIGETVIPSFGSGAILMTQGFEQPGEHITTGVVSLINCAGSSFTVPFTATDLSSNNIYTAQLSNAAGSFASPVNIGTLAGNSSSGSINVTIPLGTPSGNGYRIRVVGSMPQTIGSANSNGLITINPDMEYTYVKAGNPYQPMYSLQNGMIINQEAFLTSILVRPVCPSGVVESVEMNLQGGGFNWNIIQNVEPFALFDNSGLNVFGRNMPPGNYTLAVTGYSLDNKGGVVSYPKNEIHFTIGGSSAMVGIPTYSGSEFCAGSIVPVSFVSSGTFDVGNQFKVQLSDAIGDFTTPLEIGASASSGVINCTIPLSIPYGENYRIRVVSTNPVIQNMNPSAIKIHPNILNLATPTDDYSGDKNRKAVSLLIATNKVNSPAKVNYQAGNSIQLNAGFEAKAGSIFEAKIGGCN